MNIILSPADMVFPDPRSVVVYISLFYSFFGLKHPEQPPSPVVPVFVPIPDPVSCRLYKNICLFIYANILFSIILQPHVERAQLQESGNETQASTESGTQSVPEVPISAPNPDLVSFRAVKPMPLRPDILSKFQQWRWY